MKPKMMTAILGTILLAACGQGAGAAGDTEVSGTTSQALEGGSSNWASEQGGSMPWDAIVAGTDSDGSPLYACRAAYGGGLHLGKIRRGWASCDIPYGGTEVWVGSYDVLAPLWVRASSGFIPQGAIASGTDSNGQPLYVCRDTFNGNDLHPGKIRPGFPGCKIGYGGHEYDRTNYEVLVSRWATATSNVTGRQIPQADPFALVGGREQDGTSLYLCRAEAEGGVQLGKFRPGFTSCKFTYAGAEIDQTNYAGTLSWDSVSADWEGATNGAIPYLAVAQGHDNDGAPLFACRAYLSGGLHPGKIRAGWTGCDIGYGGREISVSSYAVLVEH